MIKLYIVEDYKNRFPDQRGRERTDSILIDILLREGIKDPVIVRNHVGKPSEKRGRIELSVSHTDDVFACALSDKEIGLDIQKKVPKDPIKIAERFFAADEAGSVRDGHDDEFLRIWTRKEALVKYRGRTLTDVLARESVYHVKDVRFIDMDIRKDIKACICVPEEQDDEISIVRDGG